MTGIRPMAVHVRRVVLVVAALAAVLLGGAVPASAHAALLRTEPAEGSVVATAPSRVTLHFSEGVLLSAGSLTVYDPAGRPVQRGTPQHAGGRPDSATIAVRSGLRDGTYTVAWKAVSADTHPVSGAWTFSVGAPSKTSAVPRQAKPGGGVAGALYGVGRYAAYLGYALLVGSAAFLAVCWPRGTRARAMRRLAVGGWATITGATIALLLLRGPYVDGTGLGAALDPGTLRSVAATASGEALVCRLLLLAAAAVFLALLFGRYAPQEPGGHRAARRLWCGGGAVLAAGIAATWSLTEHASVGIQPALAMPLDIAHLLAMAVWLGGLAALLTALYRTPGIEAAAVRRFSPIAFGCVCVLVSTGVYQSWRQVGSWHALGGTAYGRWLLVKVALVACVVGTAWFSRRWTGRLADADAAPAAAPEPEPEPAPAPAKAAAPASAAPPHDPVRAAQLARQRAALTTAAARRQRDADPARTGLRASVLVETSIAVVVLVVATVLSGSEPGRAAEESAAAAASGGPAGTPAGGGPYLASIPFDTGGPKGRGTVGVHLAPARAGSDVLHLDVTDPVGDLMNVPEVDVSFTLGSRGIGPLPVRLARPEPGAWTAVGLQLPLPGTWRMAVTVRTSAIDEVTVYRNVPVG